jgi:pilus assembly protein Flp/PilA
MMQSMMKFMRDEEGATAIEYGLIVGLIAVLLVGVLSAIGGTSSSGLKGLFTTVSGCITTPSSCT